MPKHRKRLGGDDTTDQLQPQTLHYIKGNVPGTSLTTEDIEQFVAKKT